MNQRRLLDEQSSITHVSTDRLGSANKHTSKATCSEGQDGLMDDFDALSDFVLLNDQRRGQPDDVAMGGFGEEPVIAQPQTHLPGVVVCSERKGAYTEAGKGAQP